jgi:hypothetical protein
MALMRAALSTFDRGLAARTGGVGCDRAADLIRRVQVASAVMEAEMAKKITVALEDDFDGGPADETVRFAVGGAEFEIDLNKKSAAAFHGKLAPFIKHARGAGRGPRRRVGRSVLVDPAELSNLIDKINDLNDAERESIKARWLKYLQWWDSRARRAKTWYYLLRTVVVAGGAAIPVLLALAEVNQLADSALGFTIASIITSGFVAICAGIETLFSCKYSEVLWQGRWCLLLQS